MSFIPDYYFNRIEEITPAILKKLGIKGLVLDIDNTLTLDFSPDVSESVLAWLAEIKKEGFAAIIVSNNSAERAEPFAEKCALPFVARAKKPSARSLLAIGETLGCSLRETAVVGDQLFTDMAYAKNNGMVALGVKPLGGEKLVRIKLKRILEKPFMPFVRARRWRDE